MIDAPRSQHLMDRAIRRGRYVFYRMQQSRPASFNPALGFAIGVANQADLPVLDAFGLMDDYPEANLRHYASCRRACGTSRRRWPSAVSGSSCGGVSVSRHTVLKPE